MAQRRRSLLDYDDPVEQLMSTLPATGGGNSIHAPAMSMASPDVTLAEPRLFRMPGEAPVAMPAENARMRWGAEQWMGAGSTAPGKAVARGAGRAARAVGLLADDMVPLPPPESARLTQIATTGPTYTKAAEELRRRGIETPVLDYGAGRGHGAQSLGADSFEPYAPAGFRPTYTDPAAIPSDRYAGLLNLNVLNVLGPEQRAAAVENMGRVLRPGGTGIITTRGRDVMAARGRPGPEPMSLIVGEGDAARYQKGFSQDELREYLEKVLGGRFDISSLRLGQAGAAVTREAPLVRASAAIPRDIPTPPAGLLDEAAPPAPAAPHLGGNLDYGKEVFRQRGLQLDIKKQADRIQPNPADPAFDARPTPELLPGVPQGQMAPMRRVEDGTPLPQGDRARPLVEMREQIADRMAQDLTPQLGHDTQYFYHMRPVYEALRRDGMSHEKALEWIQRDFAPTNAGTSPRTNTQQNLLNTSLLQYRRQQGLLNTREALEADKARGYGMIYGTHPRMVNGLLTGTHDIGANPKPYYFGGNIGGDLAYTTADTHAIRAAVGNANAVRPGSVRGMLVSDNDHRKALAAALEEGKPYRAEAPGARYDRDPTQMDWATDIHDSLAKKTVQGQSFQPEYPIIHDIYESVGQRLGIPTADAQSLSWFHYGDRTGLESAARSIPQLLNERLSITAQALGISPQKAFSLYRRGQIPLMGVGGAAVAPGLLDSLEQRGGS